MFHKWATNVLKEYALPFKTSSNARHQCLFTYYWVSKEVLALTNNNIKVKTILITKREEAQAIPVAVSNYALFVEGRYVTREIQSEKYCLQLELSSI